MEMDTEYLIWIEVADPERVDEAIDLLVDLDAAPEEDADGSVIAFTATADSEDDAAERGEHAVQRLADAGVVGSVARVAKAM